MEWNGWPPKVSWSKTFPRRLLSSAAIPQVVRRAIMFLPCRALFIFCLFAGLVGTVLATEDDGDSFFSKVISSGEYSLDETYVGESAVRTGNRVVQDFDEHNLGIRLISTPRVSF